MIQRIQIYKLDLDARGSVASTARTTLARALLAEISRLEAPLRVEVGLPEDAASEKSWDVSLVVSFLDGKAAEACLEEALPAAVARALGDCIVVEKGWTFGLLEG